MTSGGQVHMSLKEIKLVTFDCDGVMFDTARANRVYYSHILEHFGRPAVTDEQFAFVHMHTVGESMAYLFRDEESLVAAHEYRHRMDYRQYLKYLTIEPHLVELLEKLRPKIRTAIATNRTDTMDRLLAEFDLDGHFDLIVTSSDVMRPKPHPEALLKILDYFHVGPEQTIYIGDSLVDELAARAADVPLVAFRNRELSSNYHIDSLKEIEELLNL
jgi:HAD superfamily hydrolase (TIGR01549 family)